MDRIKTILIETERLMLRNFKPDDVSEDYVDWLNNPEINKYLSCANRRQTMQDCLAYVESYKDRSDAALIGMFLKGNGLHIGNLTLSKIDWHNKTAAIGISIGRKEYMGKGLAREALSAIAKYCFVQIGLHRCWAAININNKNCVDLYVKGGFKIEGILREANNIGGELQDGYLVSLLEADL